MKKTFELTSRFQNILKEANFNFEDEKFRIVYCRNCYRNFGFVIFTTIYNLSYWLFSDWVMDWILYSKQKI